MKKVLFENGSEQVVDYGKDGIYVDGAGYHFKVFGIDNNDFLLLVVYVEKQKIF